MPTTIEIDTSDGPIRGLSDNGLATFHGVPFARPPIGPFRFQAPVAPERRSSTLDATSPSPLCPQTPLRLKALGNFSGDQDEDCLKLTIWAPLPLDRPKPILVWLHGGALSSGGGAHPWYDGAQLARENGIVVVSPNYRLGALGFLCGNGLAGGNMGFLDQIRALEWIKDNAAFYGGHSNHITLMGQSAGATSIALLLAHRAKTQCVLFHRAIFLSGGFVSFKLKSVEAAAKDAEYFCERLGVDANSPQALQALQKVPVSDILQAQTAVIRDSRRPTGDVLPTFMYTATEEVFPSDAASLESAIRQGAAEIDAMIGTTAEEFNAFSGLDPRLTNLTESDLPAVAEGLFGPSWASLIDQVRHLRMKASTSPAQIVTDALTENFVRPIRQLGAAVADGKGSVWCFRFDWRAADSGYGACHCIELPFVFGTFDAFRGAPMLKGGEEAEMRAISDKLRSAIGRFAAHGSPVGSELTDWPSFSRDSPWLLVVDSDLKLEKLHGRHF